MIRLRFVCLLLALFIISNEKIFGQFEQKVTLQTSLSYHSPTGEKVFSDRFNNGLSIDGGVQYNLNRTFSMVALLKYTTYQAKVGKLIKEGKYNNFGISLCPKVRFLSTRKVNPYLYGGINVNVIGFSFVDIYGTNHEYEKPFNLGYTGGLGFDFKLSENLAFFLQGGYNSISYEEGSKISLKMNSVFVELGFNFNFLKSKSL